MELNEILKEKGIAFEKAETTADLINQLDKLGSILGSLIGGEPEQKEVQETSKNSDNELLERIKVLENENRQLRETSKKLLDDFDKVNTSLREVIKERNEYSEQIKNLRSNQQDNTNIVRQNIALNKMVGAILSAIETAKKEM